MQVLFSTYQVEITDVEFKASENRTFDKTVVVTFYNELNHIVSISKFGYYDVDQLYSDIKEGKDIVMDRCYVRNFSLKKFRKDQNLKDQSLVNLQNFVSLNAFYDCDNTVDFSFAQFINDDIDFSGSIFGNGLITFHNAKFQGSILFKESVFGKGNVDFQFAEIGNGNITFEGSRFSTGTKSFINTFFGDGKVNFKKVSWDTGKVDFHYSNFGTGDISFEKSTFLGGDVDFSKISFGNGKLDFRRVDFGNGHVSFEESEIKTGRTNFRSARFGEGTISFEMVDFGKSGVMFDKVEFGSGNVYFTKAKVKKLSFKGCHLNNYLDLRVTHCQSIDLSDTIVRDIIDFKPLEEKVKIDELNLVGMRNLGRIYIDWFSNNTYDLIASPEDKTNRQKAEQFRILKEDFHTNGEYDYEDLAYVEFKRFELNANYEEAIFENPKKKFIAGPDRFFQWLIFDKVGLYATNPIRVLYSMFCVYCTYSLIYCILPLISSAEIMCGGADNETLGLIGRSFYFSIITFLTIGYGDCLPAGPIKWLSGMEGWTGVFLMSYFTVAFVRKILR